jgi:hypothetical protein
MRKRQSAPPEPIKVIYYGTIHKFFMICCDQRTFKVALVTAYHLVNKKNTFGVDYINLKKPYPSGRIVEVASLDRKVIFAPGHPTAVLTVPEPYVRLPWRQYNVLISVYAVSLVSLSVSVLVQYNAHRFLSNQQAVWNFLGNPGRCLETAFAVPCI